MLEQQVLHCKIRVFLNRTFMHVGSVLLIHRLHGSKLGSICMETLWGTCVLIDYFIFYKVNLRAISTFRVGVLGCFGDSNMYWNQECII